MPLIIDGGRVPTHWAEKKKSMHIGPSTYAGLGCVRVALINNMPDAALEDTEVQFFELLDDASGDLPVFLKLYSLTGIPRSDRGLPHVKEFYYGLDDLWNNEFDGVIITGTEPLQPNLRDEPYWSDLADLLDWAETNTSSTILSCLAAHAGVLYSDGINRHRLPDKQFGIFNFCHMAKHVLTHRTSEQICFPHSRWNELRADELAATGYLVLTQSPTAGVDAFVKKKRRSLFVHFQGHPEYGLETLLKEYRRDIRRFMTGERDTYPSAPMGYFDATATRLAMDFQTNAVLNASVETLTEFPLEALVNGLQKSWYQAANRIYGNWLQYLYSQRAHTSTLITMPDLNGRSRRTRTTM